ncbi:MAG: ATP-dependent helicase [Kiritimatiellae bacterium]|nr:ATP-dependent helicase [Kiritimatiellia bacterium]
MLAGPVRPAAEGHAGADLSWLGELNPEQRRAVTHGDGPLLVVAGAGSGKTRTLAYRVAYLLATGVAPDRILLLTFTRRAAEEMVKRAAAIAARGAAVTGKVWGGTFHATANRLLRIYAKAAGLSGDFTVMDQPDAEDLLNVIRHEMGLSGRERRFPRKSTCLAIYSRCVNGVEELEPVLKRYFPWCAEWEKDLKGLFRTYVERKQQRDVLDYDDLLLYWARVLEDKEIARHMGGRFDHILVDEYQDTNLLQSQILRGMRRFNRNVMVVGDDAQSIYSFRAATVRNMLDFPKQFPGAALVTLEQNYRSGAPILETTNRVIAQAAERYAKDLWSARPGGQKPRLVMCRDETQQDEFVVRTILRHYEEGIPLRKQAVLFRVGHLSDALEIELTRRNIPYRKYGGLRFLEAAHVKDLVACLRIAENPRDEIAWFRVLQLLDGVGPATAAAAVAHVRVNRWDARSIATFTAPAAAREGIGRLGELMADLVPMGTANPAAQVERIRRFYDPVFERRYENPVVRRRDLASLEQVAAGYRSRRSFLTDLTLDPPASTSDLAGPPVKDEDWMTLSTIHSAKGCEWDVVILIHAADGWLPSDMATGTPEEIEEERRLAYVAMTRARDFLYVAWPLRYYHKWKQPFTDGHGYAQPSRFLTAEVCAGMERVDFRQEEPGDAQADAPAGDVRSGIRAMWD